MRKGKHSEETKRKISETKMGHTVSTETRRKISEANQNPSDEVRKKMSEGQRKRAPFSEEHRRKLSEAGKGNQNATGYERTEEHRRKISEFHKGHQYNLGRKHTPEARRKMSEAQKNRAPVSDETRRKLSDIGKGHTVSEETRCKISNSLKGKIVGEKHPNWKGGISQGKYCEKFNEEFKEKIRNKHDRKCFLCGIPENGRRHSVHHVNYDKTCGCSDIQCEFVPLCVSCHAKTNYQRLHWESIITGILNNPNGQLSLDNWF